MSQDCALSPLTLPSLLRAVKEYNPESNSLIGLNENNSIGHARDLQDPKTVRLNDELKYLLIEAKSKVSIGNQTPITREFVIKILTEHFAHVKVQRTLQLLMKPENLHKLPSLQTFFGVMFEFSSMKRLYLVMDESGMLEIDGDDFNTGDSDDTTQEERWKDNYIIRWAFTRALLTSLPLDETLLQDTYLRINISFENITAEDIHELVFRYLKFYIQHVPQSNLPALSDLQHLTEPYALGLVKSHCVAVTMPPPHRIIIIPANDAKDWSICGRYFTANFLKFIVESLLTLKMKRAVFKRWWRTDMEHFMTSPGTVVYAQQLSDLFHHHIRQQALHSGFGVPFVGFLSAYLGSSTSAYMDRQLEIVGNNFRVSRYRDYADQVNVIVDNWKKELHAHDLLIKETMDCISLQRLEAGSLAYLTRYRPLSLVILLTQLTQGIVTHADVITTYQNVLFGPANYQRLIDRLPRILSLNMIPSRFSTYVDILYGGCTYRFLKNLKYFKGKILQWSTTVVTPVSTTAHDKQNSKKGNKSEDVPEDVWTPAKTVTTLLLPRISYPYISCALNFHALRYYFFAYFSISCWAAEAGRSVLAYCIQQCISPRLWQSWIGERGLCLHRHDYDFIKAEHSKLGIQDPTIFLQLVAPSDTSSSSHRDGILDSREKRFWTQKAKHWLLCAGQVAKIYDLLYFLQHVYGTIKDQTDDNVVHDSIRVKQLGKWGIDLLIWIRQSSSGKKQDEILKSTRKIDANPVALTWATDVYLLATNTWLALTQLAPLPIYPCDVEVREKENLFHHVSYNALFAFCESLSANNRDVSSNVITRGGHSPSSSSPILYAESTAYMKDIRSISFQRVRDWASLCELCEEIYVIASPVLLAPSPSMLDHTTAEEIQYMLHLFRLLQIFLRALCDSNMRLGFAIDIEAFLLQLLHHYYSERERKQGMQESLSAEGASQPAAAAAAEEDHGDDDHDEDHDDDDHDDDDHDDEHVDSPVATAQQQSQQRQQQSHSRSRHIQRWLQCIFFAIDCVHGSNMRSIGVLQSMTPLIYHYYHALYTTPISATNFTPSLETKSMKKYNKLHRKLQKTMKQWCKHIVQLTKKMIVNGFDHCPGLFPPIYATLSTKEISFNNTTYPVGEPLRHVDDSDSDDDSCTNVSHVREKLRVPAESSYCAQFLLYWSLKHQHAAGKKSRGKPLSAAMEERFASSPLRGDFERWVQHQDLCVRYELEMLEIQKLQLDP